MIGRRKLLSRIMITYLAMIIPTLIVGVYAFRQSRQFGFMQVHANLGVTTDHIRNRIQSDFEKYNSFFNMILYDIRIVNAIKNRHNPSVNGHVSSFLSLLSNLDVKLGKIRIYLSHNIPDNHFFHSNELVKSKEWYSYAVSSKDAIVYPDEDSLVIAEKLPDIFSGGNLTVLSAEIGYSTLFYELENMGSAQSNIIVFDPRTGKVLYQRTLHDDDVLMPETVKKLPYIRESRFEEGGRNYLLSTRYVDSTNWTVAAYLPESTVIAGTMTILYSTGLFAAISLSFALGMIVLLNRWIIVPIRHLNEEMQRVQTADFSVQLRFSSEDEIGQLSRQFAAMANRLDTLMEDAYQHELTANEAEMKALQARINPHFLYNCLSAINMEALKLDSQRIHQMVVSLSRFYRTVATTGSELIRLSEELDNVRAYLQIQYLMSDLNFEIEYRIDEEVLDLYLPNLTIQPLVENAIEHGIGEIDCKGLIVIGVEVKEEILEIRIEDNGPGLDEKKAASILQFTTQGHGIQNVNKRIQFRFGSEYGLGLSGKEPQGLIVTTRLPVIRQE